MKLLECTKVHRIKSRDHQLLCFLNDEADWPSPVFPVGKFFNVDVKVNRRNDDRMFPLTLALNS